MPSPLLPRSEVVRRLAGVFRQHGYGGASLKLLSDATGLGRSSLYHYFPNGKADMGHAVLEDAGTWLRANVLNRLASDGSPRERLESACEGLVTFYEGGRLSCLLELFSTGEARTEFGPAIARDFRALQDAFAALAREAGLPASEAERRAEEALVAIQGSLVLARGLGDERPFRSAIADLPCRLLSQS